MAQFPPILNLQENDLKKMLACSVHIGSTNLASGNERYVHGRNEAGNHIIDLRKTWEKLILAARTIVAVPNSRDVCVIGLNAGSTGSPIAQRAVLKFGKYCETKSVVGRFTPGTLTNQIQSHYFEPSLLVLSDPIRDHQPLMESSYMNIPVIAFTNTHHSLRNIDISIPCNTEGTHAIALMYWLLAREVQRLQGRLVRDKEWEVMVDMFIYKDPEETEKQQDDAKGVAAKYSQKWESTDWEANSAASPVDEGYVATGGSDWVGAAWNGEVGAESTVASDLTGAHPDEW
jgi:small subunit ribosomal protein SAe